MTTFTDDFNRANSSNLGANWVEVSGDWSIVSNQLSSGSAGGTIILRAATAMATNDNYAQVTISTTSAVSHGVWCRGNSNITQGYLWRNDGSSWNLFWVVGGSFTSIGSFAGAAANGDVAKVQAVGSTIKGFVNGVQRVSVTDTAVTTGTSCGIRAESVSALRFDDFSAGDVTSGVAGDAALSTTATLSAAGTRDTTGSAALAATATLTTTGVRATAGTAALTATASLTAQGVRAASADASLTATVGLTADGVIAHASDAALAATAGLTAAGQRATSGDTALTISATLSADGQYGASTTADLTVTAGLAAAGPVDHPAEAALPAAAALAADGVRATQAGAGLTTVVDLTAQGQIEHTASAALTATAVLAADGTLGTPPVLGSAALTATSTLTAAGNRATADAASLSATAQLAAAGTTATAGSAVLAATAALAAAGTVNDQSTEGIDTVSVGVPHTRWTAAASPHRHAAGSPRTTWSLRQPHT